MPIKEKKREVLPKSEPFLIVGIGASAGGISALEAFFSSMPVNTNPNISFVIVQHLAPDHKSILTDIIQRYTSMHVYEVKDGMKIQPNCTYIIPPNFDMAVMGGTLELLEPTLPRGQRLPIDFFFRSLAQDQHERAIGIVLSGTGSDATQGIRAIKAEGGMVMVQNPASCEYDGMPRSALSTGLVDYELPPQEMQAKLIAYAKHTLKLLEHSSIASANDENALKKLFILLRSQTGHDFSQYKPSTMKRRIERRMTLNQIETLNEYVKYMQHSVTEVEFLFHELLIGVTSFFRDSEAFESLRKNLPKLFAGKQSGDAVRVWSTGCSTGEEAYSIAMLIYEYMQELGESFTIQIFATDIDSRAIAAARSGVYPVDISADISKGRLSRFFTSENNTYRIHKSIRDMVVFSEHNLIKDPPFSKMDLISCRNLLIYMDADLQKKIIPLFHYALNPGGILFLGNSETIGEYAEIFDTLDSKSKIFQRKEDVNGAHKMTIGRLMSHTSIIHDEARGVVNKRKKPLKLSILESVEEMLLRHISPAAVLVNESGDIIYIYGKAGRYLEIHSGEVRISNILRMSRDGLERSLSMALHKAATTKETAESKGVPVKINEQFVNVDLTVCPMKIEGVLGGDKSQYLVIFEETPLNGEKKKIHKSSNSNRDSDEQIASLTKELHEQEEFLKTTNEKLEISNEELRASNEEIQSVNEELQSTNEELETSKEELQSVNEELSTVNAELQTKVMDLSRSNNDMNNLLAGTGIGTVFVDHDLCILRYTPAVTKIINLILSDLGRPVGHIVSNLRGYDRLKEDVQGVLDTLMPKELEVESLDGKWYIMRIQPYRTLDNVIEGAVITFVEITDIVRMREKLSEANNQLLRLAVVVRDANDAITMQDLEGSILAWNPGAQRMYGWSEDEALKINASERIPKEYMDETNAKLKKVKETAIMEPYRSKRTKKDGSVIDVLITLTALVNESGGIYAIATTEREVKPYDIASGEVKSGNN